MIPFTPITFPSPKGSSRVTFGDLAHIEDLEAQTKPVDQTKQKDQADQAKQPGNSTANMPATTAPKSTLYETDIWLLLFFIGAAAATTSMATATLHNPNTANSVFAPTILVYYLDMTAELIWLRNKPAAYTCALAVQMLVMGGYALSYCLSEHEIDMAGIVVWVSATCWGHGLLAAAHSWFVGRR